MKKLFLISEDEKDRILDLHKTATKNLYLIEQIVTNYDSKYDYKKEGDKYFFKLKNSGDWRAATGGGLESIKTKVFNTKSTSTSVEPKKQTSKIPFKTKEEGDDFRRWMNKWYPLHSKRLQLDPSGSHNNPHIKRAWNTSLTTEGSRTTFGELYTKKQTQNNTDNKSSEGSNDKKDDGVSILPQIDPTIKDQIDWDSLNVNGTTSGVCDSKGVKECATFINQLSTDVKFVGDAWVAYANSSLGDTIYSKFKGLNNDTRDKVINIWKTLNERPDNPKVRVGGPSNNEIKTLVGGIVPNQYNGPQLELGDFVGIFNPDSKFHEKAFYEGATVGKGWFVDGGEPGETIKKGDAWGMNTHIGRVAAIKEGVPLIIHNVDGNVKSDPPQNLRIAWVKRKDSPVIASSPNNQKNRYQRSRTGR